MPRDWTRRSALCGDCENKRSRERRRGKGYNNPEYDRLYKRERYAEDPKYREQEQSRARERLRRSAGFYEAWEKCGGVCAYCEQPLDAEDYSRGPMAPTVDHMIPLSRGGADVAENRVLACNACNSAKGARTPREWLADENAKLLKEAV